jgi:O-antigen ligase
MLPLAALTGPVPRVGVILAALLAGMALLAGAPRVRGVAVGAALFLSPVLLLADIWHSPQLSIVHRHPVAAAAGAAVAVSVLVALSAVVSRRPWLLAPLAVVALPFRVPIQAAGTTSNLLVPLYCVVGVGGLALVFTGVRGRRLGERPEPAGSGGAGDAGANPGGEGDGDGGLLGPVREWDLGDRYHRRRAAAGWVARLLALYVVLYGVQSTYSSDFEKALQQIVFFYVPFALLFVLLTELDWTPRLAILCFAIAVGLAIVFAGIGFVEYSTKTIFLNPKLIAANDVHAYFTVNSVFFDPDIFGRFLALVMIGLAAGLVFERRTATGGTDARRTLLLALGLAVLWGGLVLTLSRSSLGALLVGLATLAGLRFRPGRTLIVAACVVAVGVAAVAASPKTFGLNQGLNGASSGRASLVTGGLDLFARRPAWGYGSGSFVTEYRRHNPGSSATLSASHTIPITIAAEQGALGELAYLALVLAVLGMLLRAARSSPARAAVAAAFLALVFHTMLYADFLEDPVAWALMAVGVALAARPAADAADAVGLAPRTGGVAEPAPVPV